MIPEEYFEQQEKELAIARQQAMTQNVQQDAMAIQIREYTVNLVKEQLSLAVELTNIENLLKGKVLDSETEKWLPAPSSNMIILTDYGVHLIMNTIMFYLNKNTLLSNYDEDTIKQKMEDFATSLTDTIFMEYEKVFQYPTFEECKEVLNERIKRKTELRVFSLELIGKTADKKTIEKEFLDEIESKVENEINKIKEQIIKNKLKRFELIIREVQDAVHSTYLRAWNGQERRTLRQHIHISETMGNTNQFMTKPPKQSRGLFRR